MYSSMSLAAFRVFMFFRACGYAGEPLSCRSMHRAHESAAREDWRRFVGDRIDGSHEIQCRSRTDSSGRTTSPREVERTGRSQTLRGPLQRRSIPRSSALNFTQPALRNCHSASLRGAVQSSPGTPFAGPEELFTKSLHSIRPCFCNCFLDPGACRCTRTQGPVSSPATALFEVYKVRPHNLLHLVVERNDYLSQLVSYTHDRFSGVEFGPNLEFRKLTGFDELCRG